jgi:chromosome segregation ATPase
LQRNEFRFTEWYSLGFSMNVVGKIFILLILVMSLSFMALSLMLYAAHPDWREALVGTGGLKTQLEEANKEKTRLDDEKKKLVDRIAEERDRAVKRLAALEQVKTDLEKEREAHNKELGDKEKALRELVDAIDSIHNTVKSLHADTLAIRGETKAAVQARRMSMEKVIAVNDDLLNAVVERLRLAKLGHELQAQLAKLLPTGNPVSLHNHSN